VEESVVIEEDDELVVDDDGEVNALLVDVAAKLDRVGLVVVLTVDDDVDAPWEAGKEDGEEAVS